MFEIIMIQKLCIDSQYALIRDKPSKRVIVVCHYKDKDKGSLNSMRMKLRHLLGNFGCSFKVEE